MKLEQAITKLEAMGVPTHSQLMAGQHMNQNLLHPDTAKVLIIELTGKPAPDSDNPRYAPYLAAYLVMLTVRSHVAKLQLNVLELMTEAQEKTNKFLETLAWTFVADETNQDDIEKADPVVVKAGLAKKGARKFLALKVYKDQIAGKDLTRKAAIAILMEEIGLTAAGASTYYANFKGGKWA